MALSGKPKSFYRPLFAAAFRRIFAERDLWLFGIFAGMILSGGAVETVLRVRDGLEPWSATTPERLWPWFENIRQWTGSLFVVSPTRAIVTLVVAVVLGFTIITLAILSQAVLTHGAKSHRHLPTIRSLVSTARKFFWRILCIDILYKLALLIPVAIIIAPENIPVSYATEFLGLLRLGTSFALLLAITVIAVYTICAITNHGQNMIEAIVEAWQTFFRHLAANLELAILLFLANLGAGLAALLFLLVLAVPYTVFYLLGGMLGSLLLSSLATAAAIFTGLAALLVLAGATVAFNYAVLAMAYEKLRVHKFQSKLSRIVRTLHWL